MLLKGRSITHNNPLQHDMDSQTESFNTLGEIQGDDYGGDSSDALEPCAKSYPELNLLIERHGLLLVSL